MSVMPGASDSNSTAEMATDNSISDEWEYEYDETETEVSYHFLTELHIFYFRSYAKYLLSPST